MRVLHVGAGNLYGGIESVLVAIAKHRASAEHVEHEFALFFEGRLERELLATGASVHRLCEVRVRRPWTVLKARSRLRAVVERRDIDAVIAHGPWCHAVIAPAVRDEVLVFYAHDTASGRHWVERWASWTVPDLIIANSQFTLGTLAGIFQGAARCVVRNPVAAPQGGVHPEDRTALRSMLGVDPSTVVIAVAARLEPWKGHHRLLAALSRLTDDSTWRCWVIGGAQRPQERQWLAKLERLAATHGVRDRISWLGQRSDVATLLAAADIYCQPNDAPEPFGMVFVEALQAGVPVVTYRMGGGPEIVDPSCGILVAPGDVPGIADALRSLVRDPGLRARLGAEGPRRARELCDPDAQVKELSLTLERAGSRA